jgi:hypothetical protein
LPDLLGRLKTALADRYRVDREIARGGMAHAFLAVTSSSTGPWRSRCCGVMHRGDVNPENIRLRAGHAVVAGPVVARRRTQVVK